LSFTTVLLTSNPAGAFDAPVDSLSQPMPNYWLWASFPNLYTLVKSIIIVDGIAEAAAPSSLSSKPAQGTGQSRPL
jgi:hypothetical protein